MIFNLFGQHIWGHNYIVNNKNRHLQAFFFFLLQHPEFSFSQFTGALESVNSGVDCTMQRECYFVKATIVKQNEKHLYICLNCFHVSTLYTDNLFNDTKLPYTKEKIFPSASVLCQSNLPVVGMQGKYPRHNGDSCELKSR